MTVKSGSGAGGTGGGGGGMGRRQSSARVGYGANRDGGGASGGGTPHAAGDEWSRGAFTSTSFSLAFTQCTFQSQNYVSTLEYMPSCVPSYILPSPLTKLFTPCLLLTTGIVHSYSSLRERYANHSRRGRESFQRPRCWRWRWQRWWTWRR